MEFRIKNFDISLKPIQPDEDRWLRENYPELERDYDTECPTCGKNMGVGANGTIELDGKIYECYCRQQVALQQQYLLANIGSKFHRLGWQDWHGDPNALVSFRTYAEQFKEHALDGTGLYIYGDVGTGKTMAASIIAKDAIKRGYSAYFTTAVSYINLVKAGWYDNDTRKYIAGKTEGSKVLVIDDFGSEQEQGPKAVSTNEFARKTIENLLRMRSQMNKITLFTSNLGPETVVSQYGQRFMSLLYESDKYVHVGGGDYRMVKPDGAKRGFII